MLLDLMIVLVCGLAILLLGLLVIARNPKQKINRLFFLLAISMLFWTTFNYLSSVHQKGLLETRLVFLGGIMTAYGLVLFMSNFPERIRKDRTFIPRFSGIFSAIMTPIVFMPQFIKGVTSSSIETAYLYPVFIIYALFVLFALIYVMRIQAKSRYSASQKQQLTIVSSGVIIYAVAAVVSNVLVPLFVDNWSSSRFGPVFSLVLVGVVAYSIVKQKLFDIRLLVARTIAYLLLGLFLATFFATTVLGVVDRLFGGQSVGIHLKEVYFAVSVLIAFSLQPLKKLFNRISNKFFYRDAYDTQVFLDELNKVFVQNVHLESLLSETRKVIISNLKTDTVSFLIAKTDYLEAREIGDRLVGKEAKYLIELVQTRVASVRNNMIVTEELQSGSELKESLIGLGIQVLAVLPHKKTPSSGFLALGPKKSGSIYGSQDVEAIKIMINALAVAVQNALRFEEIEQFSQTLQAKVDEATSELRKTNLKLRALDETKDEFISMASHQLRTPLTSVKGYLSMVLEGDVGKITGQQREMLNQSFVSSQRMVYLIADLLNVSRLRTGKFVIEVKPTNLADIVAGEVSQLMETAQARGLTLSYKKPENFPLLDLDETKIRQVVMNFMDNAIYYTPSGGNIEVTLEKKDRRIEYKVTDTGIGVPQSERHHLFTKFFRANNARSARPDGTGLGLFMAKKVIVASGGAIIFSSQEGKGSTFGFTFPLPEKH